MANRAEVLENLKKAASEGNIREAYRDFEELPFVDQLAISISPGIGDALAVYEVGEFGARGAKNVAEKDFLGALGNYGLSGLSAISLLPLFRLFRGAKAVKAIDPIVDTPVVPIKTETAEVVEEAVKDVPVPKVEEFKPLSLEEMMYTGTKVKNQGLTSKAAKFINTSKKLPNQAKLITYINELEKAGVPKGELRLLNIIDEADEIHPKLFDEIRSRNPLDKITRQRLANYIKDNQQGAISKRLVSSNQYARQIKDLGDEFKNIKENTFHVRGIDRKQYDHYQDKPHKDHFVFDSTTEFKLPDVPEVEKVKEFIGGDNLLNVARIQSDYGEEVGQLAKSNADSQIYNIVDILSTDTVAGNFVRNTLKDNFNFAIKTARKYPQIKSPEELRTKFIQDAEKEAVTGFKARNYTTENIDEKLPLEVFEELKKAVTQAQKDVPVSPYVDGKKVVALKKSLEEYNRFYPKVNKLVRAQAKKQNEIENIQKEKGLTLDSPSLADDLDELENIKKKKDNLLDKKITPNIDKIEKYSLTTKDLEDATGKKFTESLGKSLDEIFYELEAIKPGSPAVRQKYGPGTPEDRALRYFEEVVNNDEMTFDIGNGIKILKEAIKPKTDFLKGYPIDPYAKGTRTNYMKLPLRANFLKAVEEGKDGMYFDSAAKRLGKEGGRDNKLLQGVFKEGENEIDKMLKELGVNPEDYVLKPKDIEFKGPENKFDGTYVKIDDEIRKLVKEKGIDAFRFGGPVGIQESLNELNKTILPNPPDVGSIKPNDLDTLIKEVGTSPVGSEGAERQAIILAMTALSMNPLQRAQAVRKHTAPLIKKLKSLHKEKQNYVENNSATQLNKYAERLNRYNRDIKSTEDRIKYVSELYDPKSYNTGGPVDESKSEETARRLNAGEEIDDILKDLYGTAFQDSIEKNLFNQFDFKYKDDLMDIYKSDDPGANIENRARKFSTNYINSLLDDLNLPVDVRRNNYGTSFDKRFNVAPNTNVTLDAYKSDDGDFTGNLNLRYSNRGKYGNIDLQSEINELGDTQDKIKYNQDIGPFSIQAGKTSGREATGSVSYNLPSMSVGNAQTIQARAVVDNLLNAKGQLDYMYNNPNTGYFVNAGLGLNSQRGPEFNLKFGKNF